MGLDCYGVLYETDEFGKTTCAKYMRYLKGPALNALEMHGVEMSYNDPLLQGLKKAPTQYPFKKVELGGGFFLILYWI
ncbi:MAG: hypothetical protein ABR999_10840 [Methanoregula sp.]|jgi:hypothetical protein|uniref:hypothetical protein n=1 Tax=Methanoregula sp. TaxID=2052170 RepID=UPI003D0ABA0B